MPEYSYPPDSSFQAPRIGSMITTNGPAKDAKLLIFNAQAQICEEIDINDSILVIDAPIPKRLGKSGWCAVLSHGGNVGYVIYRYCKEVIT